MTDISVIIPVYNGEEWIDKCMKSIANQTIIKSVAKLEIIVYNDGSSDKTSVILEKWSEHFIKCGVSFILFGAAISKGVGAAKNAAVKRSSGQFLCFQDIDDIMHPNRILSQWVAAQHYPNTLIGSRISRIPINSTPRLVRWANNLSSTQLRQQIFTSNGPTILMPTWFCHRSVYNQVGGFDESGHGTPEDLLFFYAHLDAGGDLHRVDEELVVYTYHKGATTFSITRQKIWEIQLERLQKCILPYWNHFTIWNAGKAGRKLVRSLNAENLEKVVSFCDVDKKKIGRVIELYDPYQRKIIVKVPVVHFTCAQPPLIICVKLDLTSGQFESNLKSLNLIEGIDYILFS